MPKKLKELDLKVGHRRVGRFMHKNDIRVKQSRKCKVTSNSNHAVNIAPNLFNQNFSADKTNQTWAGDSSYVWTREGGALSGRPGIEDGCGVVAATEKMYSPRGLQQPKLFPR